MQIFPQPNNRKNGEQPESSFRVILVDSSRAFLRAAGIFFLANRGVASVETITANKIDIHKVAQNPPNIFVLEYLSEDAAWLQTVRHLRQLMPKVYILILENEVIPSLPEPVLEGIFSAGANEVYSKSVLSLRFVQTLERAESWIIAAHGK